MPESKRRRLEISGGDGAAVSGRVESGILGKIPPELLPHILKFMSSEVQLLIDRSIVLRLWCFEFLPFCDECM